MTESDDRATFIAEMTPTAARFDEPDAYQDVLPAHMAWVQHLFDSGVILASGPVLDETTGAKNGHGVLILQATSHAEALSILEQDPQVLRGFKTPTARPWLARFSDLIHRYTGG